MCVCMYVYVCICICINNIYTYGSNPSWWVRLGQKSKQIPSFTVKNAPNRHPPKRWVFFMFWLHVLFCFFVFFSPWFFTSPSISWHLETQNGGPPKGVIGHMALIYVYVCIYMYVSMYVSWRVKGCPPFPVLRATRLSCLRFNALPTLSSHYEYIVDPQTLQKVRTNVLGGFCYEIASDRTGLVPARYPAVRAIPPLPVLQILGVAGRHATLPMLRGMLVC